MKIFGLSITKAVDTTGATAVQPISNWATGRGWWPVVREPWTGAWQQNIEIRLADVLTHPTVFACVTLIASDIAKMRLRLVALDRDGIWTETENPAFSPVLRKPNRYQTRIKFVQTWQISRLATGNTYVLKQRDQRGVVVAQYVLDPNRVKVLVATDGAVYYELMRDDLSSQPQERLIVPAREIIHDVMYPLYHPLVGVGPIHASGLAATLGLKIVNNSANLFANGANPGGVLTAPGAISDATAQRLKAYWDENYTGENVGKVAVLGDGLKYEPMMMKAVDAQLREQWDATSAAVCSAFHVPAYKVGVGPMPAYNNIEALDRQYYSQALQEPIESMELLLDEGLELPKPYGTEFDLDDLLRMDSATMAQTLSVRVGAGIDSPNEARKRLNQPPVAGGETPYLQQQYWPLSQLAKRDIPAIPATPNEPPPPSPSDDDDDPEVDDPQTRSGEWLQKELEPIAA